MSGRPYTLEEDQVLLAKAGRVPLDKLARRLGRTTYALEWRLRCHHRLAGERSPYRQALARLDGRRPLEVARLFGVARRRVDRWVKSGLLTLHAGAADMPALIAFLERGGALLPGLAPADPFWQSMVAEIRADLDRTLISSVDLMAMLGYATTSIHWLNHDLGMPRHVFFMNGLLPAYFDRAAIRAWLHDHPRYQTRRTQEEL